MPLTIPDDVRDAVRRASGKPVQVIHQASGETFVVLPQDTYDALWAEPIPEGFTDAEQDYLLREAGMRAGWDDPANDIYNDLDPRKQP
jgi:hypothetical protein